MGKTFANPVIPGLHPDPSICFTGRVIGTFVTAGTVHVDWFDYRPAQEKA